MKGITLCAECTYYDKKKHRCKRGASKERFAIDPFYDDCPLPDVVEVDRLGKVGRLMLPYKGCPRGPIGRMGFSGGEKQGKKEILIRELCCMDTFEDADGNVWRPVQEEVLQEAIEILRAQSTVLTVEGKTIIIKEYPDDFDAKATVGLRWFNDEKNQYEGVYATCQYNILTVREMLKITEELFRTVNKEE